MKKFYPFGYGAAAVSMMKRRSAEANAGFFLEKLTTGSSLLDVGCGPGSITVGIAKALAPGNVVGIDIEASQVELGREHALEEGVKNCSFETASALNLPMTDASFDAVYGHTIVMQFKDPAPVLDEVKRVLKPGGLVGFREIDLGASLFHDENSAIKDVLFTLRRSIIENDGNPDIGHSLPTILSSAGLELVDVSAKYSFASSPTAKRKMHSAMAELWEQADFPAQAEELGWISAADRGTMSDRLEKEGADPASFSGTTYVEVVARKS